MSKESSQRQTLPLGKRVSPVSLTSDDISCAIALDRGSQEPLDSQQDSMDNKYKDLHLFRVLRSEQSGPDFGFIKTENSSESVRDLSREQCRQCINSRGECCRQNPALKTEQGLLYNNRERLSLKDFSSEVRASMDVEQSVHQANLMLDMTQVSVDDIVGAMLNKLISNGQTPKDSLIGAKQAIFIPGSSMLMARTIQGMSSIIESDRLYDMSSTINYDQSWLCALCNLVQIRRRHMIVARFKQPINMGSNAHEVRIFMLIVTPSKEKETKNALETGRTFATMLTDVDFRQKLLEAKNDTEFKSLMMVKAQQMSKAKSLKNRHKYMLDAAVHVSISSLNNSNQEYIPGLTSCLRSGGSKLNSIGSLPEFDFMQMDSNEINKNNRRKSSCLDSNNTRPQTNTTDLLFDINPRTSKLFEILDFSVKRGPMSLDNKNSNLQIPGNKRGHLATCCYLLLLCKHLEFGKDFWNDFKRRVRFYPSDFIDAFYGPPKTIKKTIATIWFLYFAILLPTIAFSALNTTQTHGHIGDLRKAIIGQAIGGLGFALLGGQPLVIIMTTAPLCLYTKVIHQMCNDYGYPFPAMYAAVGLWNGVFLNIYSLFGFSKLMKWCTRSTEEIFALFIAIAFITDVSKDLTKNFNKYYYTQACQALNRTIISNESLPQFIGINNNTLFTSMAEELSKSPVCRRETSLLFVLLMLGTLWLAITLYRFNKTPYLEAGKREFLADYALPTAVITMSFFGSYIFDDIYVEKFPPLREIQFEMAHIELLPLSGIFISLGLGFTLSLLFFMDQNISAAMVNAPQNRLKKGCAYHFDLLVVGLLNVFLTLYGLPMMHGVLPHSPLHVRSLADIEERVEEGSHLREVVIVNVRETRVTGIVSHVLVLGSLLLIPYPIAYVPTAVLNGLFLYMAITSLDGLQMFERILLLFTEQSKYPPNHYIRRCPQRKIHQFTILQILQLLVMCLFGFSQFNIVEMFFPVIIFLMVPFRHKIVPKYINEKYLDALD